MAETVDDLTINYEEDGIITTKELDKKVLTKGAWSTIIYRYCVWDYKEQKYGPDRYTIRRYQKRNGYYQPKSKFNVSSKDQAGKIIEALQEWVALEECPQEKAAGPEAQAKAPEDKAAGPEAQAPEDKAAGPEAKAPEDKA